MSGGFLVLPKGFGKSFIFQLFLKIKGRKTGELCFALVIAPSRNMPKLNSTSLTQTSSCIFQFSLSLGSRSRFLRGHHIQPITQKEEASKINQPLSQIANFGEIPLVCVIPCGQTDAGLAQKHFLPFCVLLNVGINPNFPQKGFFLLSSEINFAFRRKAI